MRIGIVISAAAAFLFAASPLALAFQVQTAPTNTDGSAKFSDPDDVADGIAAHLAGNGGASSSALQFGGTTLSVGGTDSHGLSPALQERLMGGYGGAGASTIPSR